MTKHLLWLDDCRDPFDKKIDWLVFSPIGRDVDVTWVMNYQEFIDWIMVNGLPDGICFDHDLSDFQMARCVYPDTIGTLEMPEHEKTGMDCAKWLTEYCMDRGLPLPLYNCQSANPVGRENIKGLLENYNKHFKLENMSKIEYDENDTPLFGNKEWLEWLEDLEDSKPMAGLHNEQGDDFDYEGTKYFKDGE